MTITYQHLVGDFENLDKVIAYNLETNWDNTNTDNVTPVFENGTDEPDYISQFDRSGPNKVLVNTIERNPENDDDEVNSDTVHSTEERIAITVIGESRIFRMLFENEINRIIWELSPNSATRLIKSDGSNSHVNRFLKSEVTFNRIDLPDNETAYLDGSEGFLTCIYYKFKT